MSILISVIVFVFALVALAKGSHWVINSSSQLARHFGISETAIGFILVAVATSLPNLVVAVEAAIIGEGGIAVGNVLGSNIATILLVLGVAAMLKDLVFDRRELKHNAEILLFITVLPLIFLLKGTIDVTDGLILLSVFIAYTIIIGRTKFEIRLEKIIDIKKILRLNLIFWVSIVIVLVSSYYTIESGVDIAEFLKIPNAIIGLTLIALGTTLPELAVGITAVRKGHGGIAIGEIIGSCVVNLTMVLGAAAVITPLTMNIPVFASAAIVLALVNIMLWYVITKYNAIKKMYGLIFVMLYVIFLFFASNLALVLRT